MNFNDQWNSLVTLITIMLSGNYGAYVSMYGDAIEKYADTHASSNFRVEYVFWYFFLFYQFSNLVSLNIAVSIVMNIYASAEDRINKRQAEDKAW